MIREQYSSGFGERLLGCVRFGMIILYIKKFFLLACCSAFALVVLTITISADTNDLEPPHDETNSIACDDCHVPYGTAPDPAPPEWISETVCKSCHIEGGMAPEVDYHISYAYGDTMFCQDCHNPHQHQELWPHDYIYDYIDTPNSGRRDLAFLDSTDFLHGSSGYTEPYDGICETCHTQTNHHRNDGSAPSQDHNNGSDCRGCHPHADGFRPTQGGCLACHNQAQPVGGGEYRRIVADSLGATGDFARTSHHREGLITEEDCVICHDMSYHQTLPDPQVMLLNVDTGDSIRYTGAPESVETFCLACHDADGAGGDITPFTDDVVVPDVGSQWPDAAHNTGGTTNSGYTCMGDGTTTGCHGNGHGSEKLKLLAPDDTPATAPLYAAEEEGFCYNCHDGSPVINNAISGSGLSGSIQSAFGMGNRHPVADTETAHSFTMDGDSFELECTTCHNPHVVTGKFWDAESNLTPVTRPDFTNPIGNPTGMGSALWGDAPGEKMSDFAAQGSGTGGWYYDVARGDAFGSTGMASDQGAVYQPPKKGSGWDWEFDGDELPDYTTFCLDCHSYTMSDQVYPVNWGQGIPTNYSGNPTTWVTARAPHGLNSANRPYYWGDVGMYGNSGNPDPIFNEPGVTRGRGAGHFMRWPYDSVQKNAGINFVLSCTDCHEAHASNIGGMLRSNPNNGTGSTIWNTMCNNCHYYYGGQHAGMSCGYASCHEQQSIHRIKKNGEYSGSKYLWGPPSYPNYTPEITSVVGTLNSAELTIEFTQTVWTDTLQTGALLPEDFKLTDVDGNNPKTIVSVSHNPGDVTATITMSAPLVLGDVYTDLLATTGLACWDAENDPAGPWTNTVYAIPDGPTGFQFNEPAGSLTINDDSGLLTGTVNDPGNTLPGDGMLHGDGTDSYVDITNNYYCFIATTELTLESYFQPAVVDTAADIMIQRIFVKDGNNYQMSVWRNNTWTNYNAPDSVASIAFWVRVADNHGGNNWKPVLTDYDNYPIMSQHWYHVKVVWNSAKIGGIPGDIYIDDQGPNGDDVGENWAGFPNCTNSAQTYLSENQYLYEGDQILGQANEIHIGSTHNHTIVFNGLIDWVEAALTVLP